MALSGERKEYANGRIRVTNLVHEPRTQRLRFDCGSAQKMRFASAGYTVFARRSRLSRSLARAASAMAVSTGFFSGPVVNTEESATATLAAPCTRENASTTPNWGDSCMRHVPA